MCFEIWNEKISEKSSMALTKSVFDSFLSADQKVRPRKGGRELGRVGNKSNYTLTAKDPKQQIWGISGGLGGLESGGLCWDPWPFYGHLSQRTEIWNLKSEIWNLESEIWNLKSKIWNLKSGGLESGGLESGGLEILINGFRIWQCTV